MNINVLGQIHSIEDQHYNSVMMWMGGADIDIARSTREIETSELRE
jgi:hypothetical protein